MHNKSIIKCPNCGSSDIYMNKQLCKCSECSTIFLLSDKTRAFNCSDYEKTFRDSYIRQYKGYNIYEYQNIFNENKLTFWYSSNDSEYISSVDTLDECYDLIDKTIELALEAKDKNE
jgi:DNA-directed RNA polymerase subunit RPC12/RpoP